MLAYIGPLDQEFATTNIKATINGQNAAVGQGVAAHEEYLVQFSKSVHVAATGVRISILNDFEAPQPAFIDLDISDESGAIHVRTANGCALEALEVEGPTQPSPLGATFGPAFRAGETLTLISNAGGSWGTEPVPFTLKLYSLPRPVSFTPNGNRLTLVVPDLGSTMPEDVGLQTDKPPLSPPFEKCEGVARCSLTQSNSFSSVHITWLPR